MPLRNTCRLAKNHPIIFLLLPQALVLQSIQFPNLVVFYRKWKFRTHLSVFVVRMHICMPWYVPITCEPVFTKLGMFLCHLMPSHWLNKSSHQQYQHCSLFVVEEGRLIEWLNKLLWKLGICIMPPDGVLKFLPLVIPALQPLKLLR
jgi:hypothetical protein